MEPMEDIPDEEHIDHHFFDILSDELALNIFKFLDLRTLLESLGVNSNFRRLITDPSVGLKEGMIDAAFEYIDRHQYLKSVTVLNALLHLFPNSYEGWKERSVCWVDLNETEKALPDLYTALKFCTDPAYGHMIQSHICWLKDNLEDALEQMNKAVELKPKEPRFYHFRAYIRSLIARNNHKILSENEVGDYEIILGLPYKRQAIIYSNLGNVYCALEQNEKALKFFDKANEMRPQLIDGYHNKAVLHWKASNYQRALEECQKMLKINPELVDAYSFCGRCFLYLQRYPDAFQCYKKCLKMSPDNIFDLSMCTSLGVKLGKIDPTLDTLRQLSQTYQETIASLQSRYLSLLEDDTKNGERTEGLPLDVSNLAQFEEAEDDWLANNNNNNAEKPQWPRIPSFFILERLKEYCKLLKFTKKKVCELLFLTCKDEEARKEVDSLKKVSKMFTFIEQFLLPLDIRCVKKKVRDIGQLLLYTETVQQHQYRTIMEEIKKYGDVLNNNHEMLYVLSCYVLKTGSLWIPAVSFLDMEAFWKSLKENANPLFLEQSKNAFKFLNYYAFWRTNRHLPEEP